jgi:hypothetical protein
VCLTAVFFPIFTEHQRFLSSDKYDPFVMTVIREVDKGLQSQYYQYRSIVWTKAVSESCIESLPQIFDGWKILIYFFFFSETQGKEQLIIPVNSQKILLSASEILDASYPPYSNRSSELRLLDAPASSVEDDFSRDLLLMEDELACARYKFGVLYTKKGQSTEEEMFSNGTFTSRSSWRKSDPVVCLIFALFFSLFFSLSPM